VITCIERTGGWDSEDLIKTEFHWSITPKTRQRDECAVAKVTMVLYSCEAY